MKRFRFGPYELDADRLTLAVDGQPLALGPRAVETLLALIERAGEVVTKAELLDRVWPGEDVEEANIPQNVYVLRRTLGAHWSCAAIETIPRRGYRFIAPVRVVEAEPLGPFANQRRSAWTGLVRWPLVAAAALCAATITLASASRPVLRPDPLALSQRGTQLYQLGHYYWNLRTKDGFQKSARYFTAVTHSDPRSPLGYAGLAEVYAVMPGYDLTLVPRAVAMKRAWSYARSALARDPRSSEAHAVVGYLAHAGAKRGDAGRDELERAIALDPRNASAHLWLGGVFSADGLAARARTEFEAAERLEPASPATESWLASALFLDRDYAAALDRLQRALDLDPARDDALKELGIVEAQRGELGPALDAFSRLAHICRCGGYPAILRAYAFARKHRRAEAHAEIAAALRQRKTGMSADVAFVYVALGDFDQALRWLRRAGHEEHENAAWLALDPRLDPVRGDARFSAWTHTAVTRT